MHCCTETHTHTLSRNAAREHNPWAVLLVWVRCNWVWLQFCLYLYCIRCMQFDCLFIYFAMALLFILIDIWVTHTRKFVVNNISLGVTLCHLCVCCCCCMYIYIYIFIYKWIAMRKTRPTSTTYLDWLNPSKRRGYRNTLLGWRRCLCLGRRRCPRRRHSRSQSAISVITYTLGGSLGYSLVSLSTKLRSLPLYSFSLSHSLSLSLAK